MENILENIYYDIKDGYSGVDKLYRKAKEEDNNIKLSDVKKWLDKQQLHQQYKKERLKKNGFQVDHSLIEFQIDLVMIESERKEGYDYILTCIDIFSRIADAELVKDKKGFTVMNGMEKIFQRMGIPKQIYCDLGSEFNNSFFKEMCNMKQVELIMVRSHAPYVERFNQTFKNMLYKVMNDKGFLNWHKYIPDLIYNYNHSYHSSIKMKPVEVVKRSNEAWLNSVRTKTFDQKKVTFVVGDLVRLMLTRGDIKTRSYKPTYSKSVYEIEEVQNDKLKLKGESDYVYEYDVLKVGFAESKKEVEEGKELTKKILVRRKLKFEDILPENIRRGTRTRTNVERLDL